MPRRWTLWHSTLVALGIGSAALTVWGSWAGSRSDYYAAIALSMSRSWSNFFFGAMDPAGTVTLDKIPGSYWVPALFVKLFGFSTFAVVLPNALAAVAAVLLVAVTARRLAGPVAGGIAGALVATTPILVAVARSNQPETFFVLGLALTAWAALRAVQQASFGWLMLAGAFIALAFQSYMLEAWAVWPALAAAYLFTRQSLGRRIRHLLIAGLTSAALSVAWIAIVSLVPPGSRPYIGSTLHNSPWEMVFGYNGLGRFGQATADGTAYNSFTPPYSGQAGVLRLFNTQLAGQIGWLIPAGLLAVAILIVLHVPARVWVFLGTWLVTFIAMFSLVAGMHQFYTAALSVPVALLIGTAFSRAVRRGMLWPPIALLVTASLTALGIAAIYGGYSVAVALVQAALALVAITGLAVGRAWPHAARIVVTVVALAGLTLTPAVWSVVTIAHPSSSNPVAGGVSDSSGGLGLRRLGPATGGPQQPLVAARAPAGPGFGMPDDGAAGATHDSAGAQARDGRSGASRSGTRSFTGSSDGSYAALLQYVEKGSTGARYELAVFTAQTAAGLIIASNGASILPIGGFSGGDPVPTLDAFTAMVQAGDIPYVLAAGNTRGGFFSSTSTTSTQISEWVTTNCVQVPSSQSGVQGLYRCAPR
ncbi:4-amino-4-deoxy-L-arabinose transferase [Microbacterium protaetiae]|uniref:4-amino-4-deoxy-L-arabinose transferase n=2 Tax=Microbacterium protaetiae TaxID=2509458 RepID=A0A4P6EHE5_9MICO|nr:4-amino-4-deoxy-L-arabinose transferase [Microbacterium protaetiae]